MRRAIFSILIFFIVVWTVIGASILHYGLFSSETFLALPIGTLTVLLGTILMRSSRVESDTETKSYERLRSILDNLPVGVYRATSDGRILEANRTFAELLGYGSVDEIKSVNLDDVYV